MLYTCFLNNLIIDSSHAKVNQRKEEKRYNELALISFYKLDFRFDLIIEVQTARIWNLHFDCMRNIDICLFILAF